MPYASDLRAAVLASVQRERPMEAAAREARDTIVRRTAAGVDRWGRAFTPYSPRYAKRKGRASPVDLRVTGDTMNLRVEVQPTRGGGAGPVYRIVTSSARGERLLNIHRTGTRRLPPRDAMGLTSSEMAALRQRTGARFRRIMASRSRPNERLRVRVF